ncbi:MAG: hypothetical protein M1819_001597 [Sarea resinae]|nr:MAG: hypothetical protein M1819_001597 [Sarea resinae]
MFKKKPNIKPLSPIRSSDRRRIADQIILDCKLKPTPSNEADPQDKAAEVAAISSLRNALLPESCLSARFETTAGPDLKRVSGTVYVGAYAGKEQRVLWVKLNERMYPTVYTLWHNPGIVPLLHTPEPVLHKLQGGADLMTPGLAGPPFPSGATKDSIVAVASLENPSVPKFVGVCEIDVSSLQAVQGVKGHAVRGIHWDGDELWAWSTAGKPGGIAPPHIEGWDQANTEDHQLEDGASRLTIGENGEDSQADGGVVLDAGSKNGQSQITTSAGMREEEEEEEEEEPFEKVQIEDKELSTKEIDDAFRKAFIYGLYHHKTQYKEQPSFGLEFPLTQSSVMSTLVQPFLPAFTAAQTASLQMKKTSWKNIKKFMKSLDKQGLVKTKDRDKNEVVILDVDFDDQAINQFVPYRLPKREPTSTTGATGNKASTGDAPADGEIGQKLTKANLYRPTAKLGALFEAANAGIKSLYLASEIRTVVTAYVEAENLVSSTNKRLVSLNPVLANAVFDGKSAMDSEVISKGSVPRDSLVERVIQACSPFWAILRGDETKDEVKPKAGAAPKIKILLETRSGNKTVTKVSGVEAYYINPQTLADELRKACAGSTSVDQLVGSSPKNPVMEVMVQGPQKEIVIRALEKRGVNKQWVEVVDKTKGKKK